MTFLFPFLALVTVVYVVTNRKKTPPPEPEPMPPPKAPPQTPPPSSNPPTSVFGQWTPATQFVSGKVYRFGGVTPPAMMAGGKDPRPAIASGIEALGTWNVIQAWMTNSPDRPTDYPAPGSAPSALMASPTAYIVEAIYHGPTIPITAPFLQPAQADYLGTRTP